jgi:alanine dehydrogenase
MRIGVPAECKPAEGRVAVTPGLVEALTAEGHEVLVELGAGVEAGCPDVASRILHPGVAEAFDSAARTLASV